jgi:hypothetical protein
VSRDSTRDWSRTPAQVIQLFAGEAIEEVLVRFFIGMAVVREGGQEMS